MLLLCSIFFRHLVFSSPSPADMINDSWISHWFFFCLPLVSSSTSCVEWRLVYEPGYVYEGKGIVVFVFNQAPRHDGTRRRRDADPRILNSTAVSRRVTSHTVCLLSGNKVLMGWVLNLCSSNLEEKSIFPATLNLQFSRSCCQYFSHFTDCAACHVRLDRLFLILNLFWGTFALCGTCLWRFGGTWCLRI